MQIQMTNKVCSLLLYTLVWIEYLSIKSIYSFIHHFTVMQTLKLGKDNTYAISMILQYPKAKTISVSYHNIDIYIYRPSMY